MSRFKPHMEILPAEQQSLWLHLGGAKEIDFVLYGGTAIALHLGHRTSIDFDFFSHEPLDRDALYHVMPILRAEQVVQDTKTDLSFLVKRDNENPVKISFFGNLRMGRVGSPDLTQDGTLEVASLDDLMAFKLKVISQRADAKDYIDMAAMLRAGVSLEQGLAGGQALFGRQFQPHIALKTLTYFEDGDLHTIAQTDKDLLISASENVRDIPSLENVSKNLSAKAEHEQAKRHARNEDRGFSR